jgi:hypothetical protein
MAIKEIDELIKKYENEEIEKLANKQGISFNDAKLQIEEAKKTDYNLEIKIINNALIFNYDRGLILKYIKPHSVDNKRRIRYIIQHSLGKINSQYRNFYLNNLIHKGFEQSTKLKNAYYDTKGKIWHLRYKEVNYYELISNIFIEYLNKCYAIFFEYLSLHNKNKIHEAKDFSKEELLKAVVTHPLSVEFYKMHKKLINELEIEYNTQLDELFEDIGNDYSRNNREVDTPDYERAIMHALENGYGYYFGFD